MASQENEFEGLVEYKQAITVMVGDNLLINKFPCKVTDRAVSKTGKHGGCKIHFMGVDIFTERKYETTYKSGENVMVPIVTKQDYIVVNINDEEPAYMSLMGNDDSSVIREDIQLPSYELGNKIQNDYNAGKDVVVTVMKAMKSEAVVSYKITK